jgi:signal transduction histidine kinase
MPDLVEQLAAHRTLGAAPRAELAWLASHGTLRTLEEGDVLSPRGVPVEGMFIVLEGRLAIIADRGTGRHKLIEWQGGDVTGLLPYSRLLAPPGDSFAEERSVILTIDRDQMPAMISECHAVTSILVHTMLDRARFFTSSALHDEKMVSLGKLSANLAHELNNPVAAIARGAALLADGLEEAEQTARALGSARLSDAQLAAVDAVRASCLHERLSGVLSPIAQAEREDAIADWLAARSLDGSIALPLAETSVTIDALDELATVVSGPALNSVLRSAAAAGAVRALASEIREAAMRISGLVAAIKGFTHMDQAVVAEPLDLGLSLRNTVAVLNAKARGKAVSIDLHVDAGLPHARGFIGELNQIWGNLIDNAIDAAPPSGRVEVTATRERQRAIVRVVDNGTGIPPEIRQRIFEPFFTTKPIGQGTGLGLDIVRRLIAHNEADIDVESRPGRTEFRVSLPLAEAPGAQP